MTDPVREQIKTDFLRQQGRDLAAEYGEGLSSFDRDLLDVIGELPNSSTRLVAEKLIDGAYPDLKTSSTYAALKKLEGLGKVKSILQKQNYRTWFLKPKALDVSLRLDGCPFCGMVPMLLEHRQHDWVFIHKWTIRCFDCSFEMSDSYRDELVNKWNHRWVRPKY